jgi:prepilin-type N-terminal cleavage/methylation domain-containing protein
VLPSRLKGFTLVELLIVFAIILVLAGILYPVFSAAKASARQTTCQSNFRQAQLATAMYLVDYEERMMPVNHQPATPANSRNDRTWVQLILPYLKSFSIFRCPSDYGKRPAPEATFDQDLVPGDTDSRYYSASLRSNVGYNYLYLAPIYLDRGRVWTASPRTTTEVADPSRTVLFADSVWDLDKQGQPFGGGSWLVLPPCRYSLLSNKKFDTFKVGGNDEVYTPNKYWGWSVGDRSSASQYGFTWPWHEGHTTIMHLDGHVKGRTPLQLTIGCSLRDKWGGIIQNSADYLWDLN